MSGRSVPQFPGKVATAGTQWAWTQQMCPLLTAAELGAVAAANKTAELAAASALLLDEKGAKKPPAFAKVEASRCQGAQCAFFVPIGTKGDGGCAEMMKVTTMHSQNLLLEAIALKMGAIEKKPIEESPTQSPAEG